METRKVFKLSENTSACNDVTSSTQGKSGGELVYLTYEAAMLDVKGTSLADRKEIAKACVSLASVGQQGMGMMMGGMMSGTDGRKK